MVIRSRRIKLAVHLAHMGEVRSSLKILAGKPKEKRSVRRPRLDRIIILKWIQT
jgi:hypothetical protein